MIRASHRIPCCGYASMRNFSCGPVSCPLFYPYRIGTIEPIRFVFVRWSFHAASLERMDCCVDADDFRMVCVCVCVCFPYVVVLPLHGLVWVGVGLRIVRFLTMSFIFPSDMLLFFRSACTLRDSSGGVHTRSMSRFAVSPILSWEPMWSIAQPLSWERSTPRTREEKGTPPPPEEGELVAPFDTKGGIIDTLEGKIAISHPQGVDPVWKGTRGG